MASKCSVTSLVSCLALGLFFFIQGVRSASKAQYADHAYTAIKTLNSNWYNQDTGLWGGAWWQSANALTTLADFAILRPSAAGSLGITNTIQNTINNAPKKFPGFLNQFYDDEGWWAMGLIRAYDVTEDEGYLEKAVEIFKDMTAGGETHCRGGIYWSKDRKYVNAIANELYLTVAASLATRIPGNRTYAEIATKQWHWFQKSGMINGQHLINDGLDANCKNNGLQTWSVNQGVILGGLVELSNGALLEGDVLETARTLAKAAIKRLSNKDGILVEIDKCETTTATCGFDGKQFKGVFIRNLGYLNQYIWDEDIRAFILRNADSVWSKDRDSNNRMGVAWAGPIRGVNSVSHGSALDALVAAIRAA
ncbi:glycosyl hydrolase [Metarhizium rileyi]|uniref:Glycosyl hydrolase n=1 Tax=Metarhizium rileyi (strain RCEF 4871) TaxID=1649241 RepID=A0A167A7U4_METRR|nr:glycosyl hydrolase [Metarhizium rileyi RCEF 4871]